MLAALNGLRDERVSALRALVAISRVRGQAEIAKVAESAFERNRFRRFGGSVQPNSRAALGQ